jgi:heme exporter protein C
VSLKPVLRHLRWEPPLLALGACLLGLGHYLGLFVAPREAMMGDVGRIFYAHVPTAWVALVTYLAAFVAASGALWTGRPGWDATHEAAVEVGVLLNALLLFQGSIWARPTWGVYWTWDPRLTTTAVMVLSFSVVLLLRRLIADPERRLRVTAIATVLAFVNVPLVYFSVKWWRTLHQDFSTPDTVDARMVVALRISAFAMLFLAIGMVGVRRRLALARMAREDDAPALPEAAARLHLDGT